MIAKIKSTALCETYKNFQPLENLESTVRNVTNGLS